MAILLMLKVLCSEQVSTLLSANFILWPWDITQAENADLCVGGWGGWRSESGCWRLVTWVSALLGGGGGEEAVLPAGLMNMEPMARMHWAAGHAAVDAGFLRHLIRIKDQAPFLILLGRNKAQWELLGQLKGSNLLFFLQNRYGCWITSS